MVGMDRMTLPEHVAIIMDGNGRWARSKGLPRVAGHRKGADAVRAVIRSAAEMGIKYLTLYSFSSENWKRPEEEVSALMGLLTKYLKSEIAEIHQNNIKFCAIGEIERLPKKTQSLIRDSQNLTCENTGLTVCLALSYGGRDEITDTLKKIAQKISDREIEISEITQELISKELYTHFLPDPDLVIRTSGENRLSNFLLWQLAYSELYFTNTLWPDFTEDNLREAIIDFNKRERRYGAVANDSI